MDKLYWIVCEESEKTLFEGRFLGRTRGAALKHLKEQVGRENLTGLVFTITEVPVPLIREIVLEILAQPGVHVPDIPTEKEDEPEMEQALPAPDLPFNPQPRADYDWDAIKECYMQGRGPRDVARIMDVPLNTLKGRIRREGWAHERREVDA